MATQFGYKSLGFGSGASGVAPLDVDFLILAGGGSGSSNFHAGGKH